MNDSILWITGLINIGCIVNQTERLASLFCTKRQIYVAFGYSLNEIKYKLQLPKFTEWIK
jgi:hypothetical protein